MSDPKSDEGGLNAAADLPPALPVHLAALVDYQRGAVVSRTLKKGQAGTFTIFAFDAGEGLSEHTAPFDALVFAVDGEAEISVTGTPHRVRTGEMLRIPAQHAHSVRALRPFKMVLVMIRE